MGIALTGLLTASGWASKHDKAEAPPPTPAARIATEPMEYHPLSSFYLLSRSSSSSLDFIDGDHLLFTFRATGLLKRLPDCSADDEDQVIRALVVHLPDGNIERSAEWRMHDRGRYLWALGDGKFLVRQGDSLATTDSTLQLHPYIHASTRLRLVKLSPDSRLLLVETDIVKPDDGRRKMAEAADVLGLFTPRNDVQLTILKVADRSIVLQAHSLTVNDLPMISDGYIETLAAQGDHWMLRYKPFDGEPKVIADVASSCRPGENPLNDWTTVVSVCPSRSSEHEMQAISIGGKKLWSYHQDPHYIWPTTASSQSGRRIALSTLRVAHPVSSLDPIDESELQEQRVEVLDVETGRLELTQNATPVLSAGQNYALSPDGNRFAVLRDNAIEIYNLPAAAPERASAE